MTGTGPAVKSAVLLALHRGATVQTECPQLQRDPEMQQSIESLRLQPTDEQISAGEMLDTDMLVGRPVATRSTPTLFATRLLCTNKVKMIDCNLANQRPPFWDAQVLPALNSWTRQAVEAVERGAVATSGLGFAFEALPKAFPVAAVTGSSGKASVARFCSQFLGCVPATRC